MSEKRKLPVVKGRINSTISDSYKVQNTETLNMKFAWVSSPETGRTQASCVMSCREFLCLSPSFVFSGRNPDFHNPEVDAPIDFEKFRLLVVGVPQSMKRNLFSAKAMLNLLEDVAGWERSKISTVNHPLYKPAFLVTGPKEWMTAPQLVSLASFILRLCTKLGPFNCETYDDFENDLHKLITSKKDVSDVNHNLKVFWDKMYILVKHSKDIFKDIDLKTAWSRSPDLAPEKCNFSILSGFKSFISAKELYNKKIEEAREVFLKLCETNLPRKISKTEG